MAKSITIYRENREDLREEWDVAVTAETFWRSEWSTLETWPLERRVAAYVASIGVLENRDHFDRLLVAVLETR